MPGGEVLALVDEGGRVVQWRRSAQELFGWSPEEAVGRPVAGLVHGAPAERRQPPHRHPETTAVLVRPVRQGARIVWQVTTADDTTPQRDTAVLDAVFSQQTMDLHVLDDELRVVRTRPAAPGPGSTAPPLLGRPFTEAYALEHPEEEAAVARAVLAGGQPVVGRLLRGVRVPGRTGSRALALSYFRLEDSRGGVLGLVVCALDVTERENARQRLTLLEDVRARVGHRMSVMDVCWELVEAVVPGFAGSAEVDLVEDVVCGQDPPPVPVHPDTSLRRAAARGRPGSPTALGAVRRLSAGTPASDALSDLRPRLLTSDQDSPRPAGAPGYVAAAAPRAAPRTIVAPLALHGHALGVARFSRHAHQAPFEEDDLTAASAICAHAAWCLESARQYMREWIIASTVQRRLLPGPPVIRTTVETAPLHLPGPHGGGAWHDTIELPGARTALVVGDVAGQGIAAAITMGLLRTALHTLAALDLPPDELLARLSDTTARLLTARAALPPIDPQNPEPLAAACAVAVWDPVDLTCTIARAGLPEPLALHPDGTTATLPVPPGPPLGTPGNVPFPAITLPLPGGTILAMATTTLADQVLAPTGRLRPLLDHAATTPLPHLRDTIATALTPPPTSEALLLLARTSALPADRVLTLPLPPDPTAAPIARAATRRQLAEWDADQDTTAAAELIVSELTGNAVRHGAPPLRLRLILDRKLTCEVSDSATAAPHITHPRTLDETGRGLLITATLADQWGARHHPHGKTVWTEQPSPHPGRT